MQEECYSAPANGLTDFSFNGKELQTFADLYLYDYHWRQYDPQLGRWHNVDPSADSYHGLSPYNYCFNNPVMTIDPDGKDPITAAILIGAAIGAVIGGGSYAVMTPYNQWNLGGFLKSVAIGAVSGAVSGGVSGGLGAIAPAFAKASLLAKYAGKAAYAGFTGAASSTLGMFTSDLLDNGQINGEWEDYGRAALMGGGIAAGISIGYSIHDYATWDRFDLDTRMFKINEEFGVSATYDETLNTKPKYYAETKMTENSGNKYYKTRFSKTALSERNIARSIMKHELKHIESWDAGIYAETKMERINHEHISFSNQIQNPGKNTFRFLRFVSAEATGLNNDLMNPYIDYSRYIKAKHLWFNLFR